MAASMRYEKAAVMLSGGAFEGGGEGGSSDGGRVSCGRGAKMQQVSHLFVYFG